MKTPQDRILDDIARHLGEQILRAVKDAHSTSQIVGISEGRFNLRAIEVFGYLFATYTHHVWPNMPTNEIMRILECSIKQFDENLKELRR